MILGPAAALLLISVAQPAAGSFDISRIGFTELCEPNPAFERLLGVLIGRRPDGDRAVADPAIMDVLAGNLLHKLELDEAVAWNGLRLKGVELQFGIERGPANYGLLFEDEPTRVVAVLNERGFDLRQPGAFRDVPGLEGYASMGVDQSGERSALWCMRD
jgi:hypothetical protein